MKRKVLIVDDHLSYSSVLSAALKTKGFDVETTADVDTVLTRIESIQPDVILLDIMMPKMGGPEIRAELLKRPATRAIPVIYLTGLRAPGYPTRAKGASSRNAGVRTIGKSDDIEELLKAIQEVLGA